MNPLNLEFVSSVKREIVSIKRERERERKKGEGERNNFCEKSRVSREFLALLEFRAEENKAEKMARRFGR